MVSRLNLLGEDSARRLGPKLDAAVRGGPNVVVHTAGASYGHPTIQASVEFDGTSIRPTV